MPAAETPVAYLGIDVGKSSHSACALDAGGGVAFRAELANRPDDIDRLLERAGSGALVVVDQKRNIGALVLARAHAHGNPCAYLPGYAEKQARGMFPGIAKTDAIDAEVDNQYGSFTFIDTAGIRRKSKVDDRIEKFSVMRAQLAIERADVCIIMLDARDGVTEQDTKIAGMAHEAGKASIIVVNKWDLVEKDGKTMDKLRKDVYRDLAFMSYAPVLFISALTGQRAERIFELVNYVNEQSAMRITTGMLNNVLADAQARQQPPTDKGRRLKIYYMTQTGVRPPNFVIFCNSRELFHFSYQRYIENQIRAVFGLEGTPIRIVIRQKGDKEC